MESLTDDTLTDLDEQDPSSMERLMKRMGNDMGGDFTDEMTQAIDTAEENNDGLDGNEGE